MMLSVKTLVLCVAAVAVAVLGYFTVPASGQPEATTTITVTMGKPSEFRFTLSKKTVPVGTVIFKVVNRGKLPHDFKIAGKKTPMIKPGKTATLKVSFKKKGSFTYVCTITGHASLGMKGALGIAVRPTPSTTTAPPAAACANPVSTTVDADMYDYGYTLSSNTFHCGTVTFRLKNSGAVPHNLVLEDVPNGVSPLLDGGQSATWTVTINRVGRVNYLCTVPHHAELGMTGFVTTTA